MIIIPIIFLSVTKSPPPFLKNSIKYLLNIFLELGGFTQVSLFESQNEL